MVEFEEDWWMEGRMAIKAGMGLGAVRVERSSVRGGMRSRVDSWFGQVILGFLRVLGFLEVLRFWRFIRRARIKTTTTTTNRLSEDDTDDSD